MRIFEITRRAAACSVEVVNNNNMADVLPIHLIGQYQEAFVR